MLLFNIYISFIIATAALFFSIAAYNLKRTSFFYVGISCLALVLIGMVLNYDLYWYEIQNAGSPIILSTVAAFIISIVFLALSQSKKKNNDDNVTDAFLDDIIEGEDEEWDAES